jgi:Amt family ammonium transporter
MTLQMSHTSPLRIGLMAAGALAAFAAPAIAQDAAAAPEFASAAETAFIFNTLLFLIGGFLVMWMAAGFAMLEAGLVRSKNVSMQCLKNIALYSIAGLMFWVIGYSLMYTNVNGGYFGTPLPYSWTWGRRIPPTRATTRLPPTGSSRWCSAPPPLRSSPARWPSASSCGRS